MDLLIYILIAVITVLFFRRRFSRRHYPPGPPSVPLLGSVPFMAKNGVEGLSDPDYVKYGKVVKIQLGMRLYFVFNDFQISKDLFSRDIMSDRNSNYYIKNIRGHNNQCLGVISTSGSVWSQQRRFALKTLKDFGFGKGTLDSVIQDEANFLINDLLESSGKNMLINTTFNTPIINVLWKIVANKRFDPKAKETEEFMAKLNDRFRSTIFTIYHVFPFLRPFGPLLKSDRYILEFKTMIRNEILEHEKDHDPEMPPRDFIDMYLNEIKKGENTNFHREQLVGVCLDFFQAGSETSSTTLMWAFLYLAINPKIQIKCQNEIDEILGKEKLPVKEDMNKFIYLNATIMEVQRISFVGPLSLPHQCSEDIHVDQYVIPKGSICFTNLRRFLTDPEVFPNPYTFNPDRFIKNGKIEKPEQFVPFGIGKRMCMGDTLAKHEIFIFLAMILQRVNIGMADDDNLKPDPKAYTMGFTTIPKPFYVKITKRI